MAHEVMEPGTAPMGLVAYAHPECPLHSPVPGDEEDHTDYEQPWDEEPLPMASAFDADHSQPGWTMCRRCPCAVFAHFQTGECSVCQCDALVLVELTYDGPRLD